jgi:hypothetical protein
MDINGAYDTIRRRTNCGKFMPFSLLSKAVKIRI